MTAAKANDVLNMARKSAWDTRQARNMQSTDVMCCWYTLQVVRKREEEVCEVQSNISSLFLSLFLLARTLIYYNLFLLN